MKIALWLTFAFWLAFGGIAAGVWALPREPTPVACPPRQTIEGYTFGKSETFVFDLQNSPSVCEVVFLCKDPWACSATVQCVAKGG